MSMARDIDYAATAVRSAIVDKFGRGTELADLEVAAQDRTILLAHHERRAEGTRDDLLAAVRKAGSYPQLWDLLPKPIKR